MLAEFHKQELKEIWEKYSNETLTEFDKIDYYNIKEKHNDIGDSIEGLSQKQIARRCRKYHSSIDTFVKISKQAA